MDYPNNDASTDALVAFCRWNDSNGNWPVRSPADPSTLPPTADHVWYDWERDAWLTDAETRAGMLEIIGMWRAEEDCERDTFVPVTRVADTAALDHLSAAWGAMCEAMGRPCTSADEFLYEHRDNLTDAERERVQAFIRLWDACANG